MRCPIARHIRTDAPARPWPPLMAHPGSGDAIADGEPEDEPFVCAVCGGTDLPEAGGWDPPICLECDAQINFDLEEEMG
jgi:hypothetical protein